MHRPGVRVFYFDPFGTTAIENIKSMPLDHAREHNYIIFFDQEPINLARHRATFDHIHSMSNMWRGPEAPRLVVSEKNSAAVNEVCDQYGFDPAYYFFHGWAALDWFRGYDRCVLMEPPKQRRITRTFMSPNRIVGGDRWHRAIMMYHFIRLGLTHNHISMPDVCPVENEATGDIAARFQDRYPDIREVFTARPLFPFNMPGETDHPMTSFKLDLWQPVNESMVYVVTETVANGDRHHLTEKVFKPIASGMPFMLVSTAGSLAYLRSYGFKTFSQFWDESYDDEPDIFVRMEKIANELHRLDRMPLAEKNNLWHSMADVVQHNHQHFYQGGFERELDQELQDMLWTL